MSPADTGLADDCFAHDGGSVGVAEALALLKARVGPVTGIEPVPLAEATGRILAEPLVAGRDVPAFDNVAVDGWALAFRPEMASGPVALPILPGRAAAGHPFLGRVPEGRALRVLTGAVMPDGCDTVVLEERVAITDGSVLLPEGLAAGQNRRRAGEDIAAGTEVIPAGTILSPRHVGVAAALGRGVLPVRRRLKVAILSTGDELLDPDGGPLPAGRVHDANRPILAALLRRLPVEVRDLGILPDDAGPVRRALLEAAEAAQLILSSGGASRGDEDHVVRSVAALGRLDFWRIALKPGRPLAFGRLGEAAFLGLPGNPVAAAVCFALFARPLLLALAGAGWPEPRRFLLPAAFALERRPGRTEMLRGALVEDERGQRVSRIRRQGSGMLTGMTEADGLILIDESRSQVREGDLVPFYPFSELGLEG